MNLETANMQVTLNLLSPEKKSELRSGFVLAYAQTMLLLLFVVVTFCSGFLLTLRLFVRDTFNDVNQRVQSTADDTKALSGSVDDVNAYLSRIDQYEKRFVAWSPVIASLARMVPPGAQLSSLSITPDGQVTISGIALERSDVLTLQDNLNTSPLFKNVSAPLSNILQKENVSFSFSMDYAGLPNVAAAPTTAPTAQP